MMIDSKHCFAAPLSVLACVIAAMMLTGCEMKADRSAKSAPKATAAVVVKLIAFNDFHGNLNPPKSPTRIPDPQGSGKTLELPTGGIQYLSTLVSTLRARNERNVVVAAGDLISGSPLVSALFHHEPTIELLNQLGLEFSAVGNHEFDAGRVELLRMQNGGCSAGGHQDTCRRGEFAGAKFKYLAANVIDVASGKSLLPPYAIKTFTQPDGTSFAIAFIGLVLKGTPSVVIPEGVQGLTFADEADTANALIPELRARGIESIVVLIHEGGDTTARSFDDASCPDFSGAILQIMDRLDPAIDVVVSGHTHHAYICRHGGRLVTSAGSEGRLVTDIDLTIDPGTKNITSAVARQLAVVNDTAPNPLPERYPTVSKDTRMSQAIDFYNAEAAPLAHRQVGTITKEIVRSSLPSGESPLGDLIADAQLAATQTEGRAQIAFMNMGGMRADLRSSDGIITYSDIFSIHPFGNGLVTLTLNGAQIDTLLEQQWTAANTMLQVSNGFTYEWDNAAAKGERVAPQSIRLHGAAIDPAQRYRVTVNEFLAQGGDGFAVLSSGTDRIRGVEDVQALERYLSSSGTVTPPRLGRIRLLSR